ncbi:MAG: Rpn family recombination-promoting nuclease/putative transposase [Magnetococcales bacterium]|nr:Rpn family recombination-promoting nuclease/putative transposase [Magnetococcales bacterium]
MGETGDLSQPHDRSLKSLLSHPERAGILLRERLPEAIACALSPEPPELVEGSFVDAELRGHLTDRLFRAKTLSGRETLLYVLIEHKSAPDAHIAWQLLRYSRFNPNRHITSSGGRGCNQLSPHENVIPAKAGIQPLCLWNSSLASKMKWTDFPQASKVDLWKYPCYSTDCIVLFLFTRYYGELFCHGDGARSLETTAGFPLSRE